MKITASNIYSDRQYAVWFLAVLVAVMTFLLYLPALRGEFLIWDDPMYVLNNPHIRSFDLNFISWAFTDISTGLWLPVTWISYAFDDLVWGMDPFGFHLTSNILHALNSMLVVILVVRLLEYAKVAKNCGDESSIMDGNGIVIAGGVVGALFGIHPLHVESVAWVSDRKDLLCSFFFIWSLIIYVKYVVSIKSVADVRVTHFKRQYFFCLSLFMLSLASKGMAVTFPLVLLILDYYPFSRIRSAKDLRYVVGEKIPFFLLSLLISVISCIAQRNLGALTPYGSLTLYERTLTAVRATAIYLWKMVVPLNLVPYYPHPTKISIFAGEYLICAVSVLGFSLLCTYLGKQKRILICVWCYYLLVLLPVSGFVPIGAFSMADRYTYLPSIGVFLMGGLAVAWLWLKAGRNIVVRWAIIIIVGVYFFLLAVLLSRQIKVWNNSVALWSHVIEKGPYEIPLAYNNRGMAFLELGKYEQAIADCSKALTIEPGYHLAYYNRGKAFMMIGRLDLAMKDLNRSIALEPKYAEAYALRGDIHKQQGNFEATVADYTTALSLDPELFEVFISRGIAFKELGQFDRAIEDYNRNIALLKDSEEAYNNRGVAYRHLGRLDLAVADYSKAIAINPGFSLAYCNRGIAYKEMKNYQQAVEDFKRATSLSPDLIKAYLESAECFRLMGRSDLARQQYESACSHNSLEGCTALKMQIK